MSVTADDAGAVIAEAERIAREAAVADEAKARRKARKAERQRHGAEDRERKAGAGGAGRQHVVPAVRGQTARDAVQPGRSVGRRDAQRLTEIAPHHPAPGQSEAAPLGGEGVDDLQAPAAFGQADAPAHLRGG